METTAQHLSVDDLVERWSSRFAGLSRDQIAFSVRLQVHAIRTLAEGRPVTADRLAADLELPVDQVSTVFEQLRESGAEVDDGGRLIGLVLTLNATRHRFRVKGVNAFAWCALDTLFLPAYLDETADIASSCPVTGETIQLTVAPDGVLQYTPAGAVVSVVDPRAVSSSTDGPQCEMCLKMNYFISPAAARKWQADHPGVAIRSVEAAFQVAQVNIDLMRSCC